MAALTDLSDVVNRLTGGNSGAPEFINFFKNDRVAGAAGVTVLGRHTSLWEVEGSPGHGAVPTTVAVPTNATAGGLQQTDPAGSTEKRLIGAHLFASTPGQLVLYDRLLHIGSLDGTVTTAQTVGGSLGRYTDGIGVEIWVDIYTQIGTTATTITASYTDENDASKTSPAVAIGGTGLREVQRTIHLPYAAGGRGCKAVTSVTLAATTGTAGNFGVTLAKPIAVFNFPDTPSGAPYSSLIGTIAPVKIQTDACLAWRWLAAGTVLPRLHGLLSFIEK